MTLVQSNTPEVVQAISSGGVRASRWINDLIVSGSVANVVAAVILLVVGLGDTSLGVLRVGIPLLGALNALLICRARSARRSWVVAITTDKVYVRLNVIRGRWGGAVEESEVAIFEVSEIASISMRGVEVLFSGPRGTKQWLVIEPAGALPEEVFERLRSLSCAASPCDPGGEILVDDEQGCLTIKWQLYRPALRAFMNAVARKCPSLVIAQERSQVLDLRRIWREPEAYQREMLAEAKRIGFGAACALELVRKKHMSFSQAMAYMAGLGRADNDPCGGR